MVRVAQHAEVHRLLTGSEQDHRKPESESPGHREPASVSQADAPFTPGPVAIVLLYFRVRGGLTLLLSCAPLLMVAAEAGAPPSAFPNIERLPVLLLERLTSALWGCVVTYALTAHTVLFSKSTANRTAP